MNNPFLVLLDKSTPFDMSKVQILDQVTDAMYGKATNPNDINTANKVLNELKNDPDFWMSTDFILENSSNPNTKFLCLVFLEDAIKTKWNIIPPANKDAIRNYVMSMVINLGTKGTTNDKNSENIKNKANMILVEIVKYEWNSSWTGFIPEICGSSYSNQNLCENNLTILKLLSEEIFDYSKNQMTSKQIGDLKNRMINDFKQIFDLCYFVLKNFIDSGSNAQVRNSLVKSCLETLNSFLSWIPAAYIFASNLIQDILLVLIDHQSFKLTTMKCLIEIVNSVDLAQFPEQDQPPIKEKMFILYSNFVTKMNQTIPCDYSLLNEREKVMQTNPKQIPYFDMLTQSMALFFTNFFERHLGWLEPIIKDSGADIMNHIEVIRKGFQYLIMLTELPDQIFKICVEFWYQFCQNRLKNNQPEEAPLLLLGGRTTTIKTMVYTNILSQLRKIIISRMAKPQEVLIVIDELGNPGKEILENTEDSSLYEVLKELMISLTKLDWENTKNIMVNKLEKQLDGSEWSFDNLNSLCWAFGSISGTLPEHDERTFLILTVRTLLNLCEIKKGKENKAVVASNIMYVVGQYPKFLKTNWNFLKTVVKKLFEFMHESFPGVKEMACNTFLKIAKHTKEQCVIVQTNEDDRSVKLDNEPYIHELIRKIPEETAELDNILKLTFYEAIGHIISAEKDMKNQQYYLKNTLENLYEDCWTNIINQAKSGNIDCLREDFNMERIDLFLKVNERLSFASGFCYHLVLESIFPAMIDVYSYYSQYISSQVGQQGKNILNFTQFKKMRTIKRDVLRLIHSLIENVRSQEESQYVACNFVQPLMTVLEDYANNSDETKESDVLLMYATITERINQNLKDFMPRILELIFNSTLGMITSDFNSFPDIRMNFFKFLKAVINNAFNVLFSIPAQQFKTMIDCVIWAIKHELPAIYDIGLEVLSFILKSVNMDVNVGNQFYSIYYMVIMQDVLFVLTDSLHKNGFKRQAQILYILLQVIENNFLTVQLTQDPINNKEYVYGNVVNMLSSNFTNITKQQTEYFIQVLFQKSLGSFHDFKVVVRDYLIQLKHFSQDFEMLYEDDEKKQIQN